MTSSAGIFERQRTQQCRFDDGEERRVGADPEREGQNGGRGEARFRVKMRIAWRTSCVHMVPWTRLVGWMFG